MKNMLGLFNSIVILVIFFDLQGCMNTALTGAQVAYGHSHIQKTLNDQYITTQAYRKLYQDTNKYKDANISVATFHQKVLLAGQVSSLAEKKEVGNLIKNIPDVLKVYNLTEVTEPSSGFTRLNDTWITTKIKAKFIATNEIDPDEIKVVTENGSVFLMGTLLASQAEIAVDVARNTDGVQNVVKIFTYLRISES